MQWYLHTLHSKSRHVVLVVGNTGSGISSTINLIAGFPATRNTGPDASRLTWRVKSYPVDIDRTDTDKHPISLYEIPGFEGNNHNYNAKLIKYIRCLHKSVRIDLVLYCARHPLRTLPHAFKALREGLRGVPFAAVVTGLEREPGNMRDWWTRSSNGAALERRLGLSFDDYVCVTTLPVTETDLRKEFRRRREESQVQLKALICRHCDQEKVPGTGIPCPRYLAALDIMRTAASVSSYWSLFSKEFVHFYRSM